MFFKTILFLKKKTANKTWKSCNAYLPKPITLGVKWPKPVVLSSCCMLNEVNGSLFDLSRTNI